MTEGNSVDYVEKDLFRLLLEFKDYAVIRVSPAGTIMSWNLGAQYIYGFTDEEMISRPLSDLYAYSQIDEAMTSQFLQTAASSGRCEEEGWRTRMDGSLFYANIILTALYDDDKVLTGFAHVTKNITVRKQLEQENKLLQTNLEERVKQRTRELEVVNKELEAFSYSVSHDLRAPLRAVSGYAMILKEDYSPQLDAEATRLVDTILANAKMMGNLIDDLLSFSKMARLQTVQETVDMNQLVQQCINTLTVNMAEKPTVSIQPLAMCVGDRSMLQQVWFNLLDNAIKYSSRTEQPNILVGMISKPQFDVYFVKDNGIGFDMKYVHKLFGVFQRLHRQDEFEGTGLGLALAQRIINRHGGEIWAEAAPQQGATFYFSIPKTIHE